MLHALSHLLESNLIMRIGFPLSSSPIHFEIYFYHEECPFTVPHSTNNANTDNK